MTLTAWEAAAQQWEMQYGHRASGYDTPGDLAKALDPRTVQTPALDLIDAALVEVAEGRCERLIISMAPQEGKSERVSRRTPLWLLVRNSDLRIAIASYEHGVARRWGRAIRNDIAEHPELGLTVRYDTSAAHEWQLDGHRGGVYCVGVGGALTGRPVDCFVGSTRILTEHGYTHIRDVHQSAIRPRVLTFNHDTGTTEWRDIVATRAIADRELVEVTTATGRRFTCTPDHRIYTADGYRPAALLRPGDILTIGRAQHPQAVRGVRQGAKESGRHLPYLLHGGPERDLVDASVHPLRQRVSLDASRAREEAPARTDQPLLLTGVRRLGTEEPRTSLPELRQADGLQGSASPVLLQRVPGSDAYAQENEDLPSVRKGLRVQQHPSHVLRPHLRGRGPLDADGGQRQLPLQGRPKLRDMVSADAPADRGTRRASVSGVLPTGQALSGIAEREDRDAQQPAGAPHQRTAVGQSSREPDPALQDVPCGAPQIGHDTVSVVRHLRGKGDTVYDLQVDGNHNFFAEEVLVHNCLFIDDPIKDRKQADSLTYRDNVWEWWTNVARTRLAPGAPVVLILTRWHEDDLAGRLLAQQNADPDPVTGGGEGWRVINIPAMADHRPERGETDPLGREPGEWMVSARGRTPEQFEKIRQAVGPRTFESLYQGKPAPVEGNLFKRDYWRYYKAPLAYRRDDGTMQVSADQVIQSWDMTFKDTKGSDYVVGQVWARRGAEAFLLDQVRDRLDFTATCKAVETLSAKWPQAVAKLVEDKANGPAVIAQLRRHVSGLIPVDVKDSKLARASAVAPFAEAGNVHLPDPRLAPWVGDFIEEAASFPNAAHDDQVDGMSQALARLLLNRGATQFMDQLLADKTRPGGDPPALQPIRQLVRPT